MPRSVTPKLLCASCHPPSGHYIERSATIGPLAFTEHPWSTSYDTGTYLELLATQSDHRMLEPATRDRLYEAVAAVVDAAGGAITVSYVADLYLAHRIG